MRKRNLPEREIRFAAKTGFLTKRLWEEFFSEGSPSWKRRVWKQFETRGIFRPHPSPIAVGVLVLNRRDAVVERLVGKEIAAAPFVSQLQHDETVARILLMLQRARIIRSFVTEIELKQRPNGERRFAGVVSRIKYPDAIVSIGGPSRVVRVAIELELTRKEPKRYRQCLDTYASTKGVDRVVFISCSDIIVRSIKRTMRECLYPMKERPIGFGKLEEWIKDPATATIRYEGSVTSLEAIYRSDDACAIGPQSVPRGPIGDRRESYPE